MHGGRISTTVRRVLLVGVFSLVVYPLSYAPVDRALDGADAVMSEAESITLFFHRETRWTTPYRPVMALIDHTWMAGPLLM